MAERNIASITDALWADLFLDDAQPGAGETSPNEAVAHLTSLYSAPVPGAARERARQRVFDLDTIAKENTMTAAPVPISLPTWNPPHTRSVEKPPARWTRLSIAAALLILLAGLGSWFAYDRYASDDSAPAVIPATQSSPEHNWPIFRGNPARTGTLPGSGPVGNPVELWQFATDGVAYRSPIVVDGTVFGGSADGYLYALDAATGSEQWRFQADGSLEMTPAYLDGVVYIPSQAGTLYAIDATTGAERWTFREVNAYASPTFADGSLFVASSDGTVYALDSTTGDQRWSFQTGGPVSRAQAVVDGVVYTGSEDGNLYALRADDGSELWHVLMKAGIVGTPAVDDGVAYVTLPDGLLYAIDTTTGAEQYHIQIPGGITPVTVSDGVLYLGAQDDHSFHALNAADGSELWSFQTQDRVLATPALVDGVLYGAGYDKTVYALDAATGEMLWQFAVDGAVDYGPAVADGVVYVSTDAGTIYAIGGLGPASDATPSPPATPVVTSAPVQFLWSSHGDMVDAGSWLVVPIDLALAPDGTIWVLDSENNRFQIIGPDGNFVRMWGSAGSGDGQFAFSGNRLGGIAFGPDGSIYVADGGNQRVQVFAPDGTFEKAWGTMGREPGQFMQPVGIAVDPEGYIYVSDFQLQTVQKFDADGTFVQTFGEPGPGDGQLDGAQYISLDTDGNLYVAQVSNNRVSKFAPDGTFMMNIGSRGPGDGQFNQANGVTVADDGTVYVADTENHRVQAFDADGTFLYALGGENGENATADGQFSYTTGVRLDGAGNLYVTDAGGGRLQKFALVGDVSATPAA